MGRYYYDPAKAARLAAEAARQAIIDENTVTFRSEEIGGDGGGLPEGVHIQPNAGNPAGNLVPDAVGALCIDTTYGRLYEARGLADTDWVLAGAGPGCHVQTTSVVDYDQDNIPFDQILYDPDELWVPASNRIDLSTSPEDLAGIYIVSAYVEMSAGGTVTAGPEFEVTITSTVWNFDPLVFNLTLRNQADRFAGSISMPVDLGTNCRLAVDGFWSGGGASSDIGLAGLSIFRIR